MVNKKKREKKKINSGDNHQYGDNHQCVTITSDEKQQFPNNSSTINYLNYPYFPNQVFHNNNNLVDNDTFIVFQSPAPVFGFTDNNNNDINNMDTNTQEFIQPKLELELDINDINNMNDDNFDFSNNNFDNFENDFYQFINNNTDYNLNGKEKKETNNINNITTNSSTCTQSLSPSSNITTNINTVYNQQYLIK